MHRGVRYALATASLAVASITYASGTIEGLARTCNNCHGVNGVSAGDGMPSISGLPESYLKTVMMEWKEGKRYSATMGRLIKGYTEEEIAGLAAYFSKLPWTPMAQKTDPGLTERGRQATQMCISCHGQTGKAMMPTAPNLNGQDAKYIELEMRKYQDDAVPMPAMMRMMAKQVKPEDLQAVAHYYASQK
jgi:sulfide dehydrogenase cytochrome subunit